MDREELIREIIRARTALTLKMPFVASILRRTKIKFSPSLVFPAAVDRESTIWLGPGFERLGFRERAFVLAHEALHASLRHAARMGGRDPELWNVAADVIANHLLSQELELPSEALDGRRMGLPDGWERMSVEELYEKFPKGSKAAAATADLLSRGLQDLLSGSSPSLQGEELQEGDKSLYDSSLSEQERERKWKEVLRNAAMAAKTAGRLPAELEVFVDRILKPKVPVRSLLRQYIVEGLGRTVVGTWVRESRKTPEMPGIRRFATPNLLVLIDTSGSIGEEELALFLGTVQEFVRKGVPTTIVCWDVKAYEPIKVKGNDVLRAVRNRMKGRGGTLIRPALQKALSTMKTPSITVVVTDGHIFDWEQAKEELELVARRSLSAVLLWTDREVSHPMWKTLRLETA